MCTYPHTHIHTYTHIHIHTYTYTYTYIHTYTHTYTYTYVPLQEFGKMLTRSINNRFQSCEDTYHHCVCRCLNQYSE